MRWILITFLGIVSFVAFVFYYKIYSNSTQKNNNFDFCYLMTWNEISWNAILLSKKITMQAGNEKIIMNGLKLDNLKVKNKKKKFRNNLAMNNSILYCKFHPELCYKRPYWEYCSVDMLWCRLVLTEAKEGGGRKRV